MNMNIPETDQGDIKVSGVSIAQLSRGLYRSTAAAFKELVSNAWDADAESVRIDTNYPEFSFISCVDNGPGMTLEQFLDYFNKQGIGYCFKRKGDKNITDKYERPIIGRLGIGMLAIGQLCHSFEIESHYINQQGKGEAYKAEIILLDESIPLLDENLIDENMEKEEIEVGKWRYDSKIPYDESKQGFRIYSADVRDTFTKEMKASIDSNIKTSLAFDFSTLHKRFYDETKKSIRERMSYLENVWELSILCPLPYYEKKGYPFCLDSFNIGDEEFKDALKLIEDYQSRFRKYNFRVIFDGIGLKRYIQFPTEYDTTPRIFYTHSDEIVAGRQLKYSGYIFAQTNAITPLELNGLQVRLRGVGIGGYDSTFLKYYKQIETIRSRWVSGEIFVEEGLESALNIDRDSFNEHDEHFKKLQSELHEKLDKVFNTMESIAKVKRDVKRESQDRTIRENLESIAKENSGGRFELLERELGKEAPLVSVNREQGEIILNTSLSPLKKKKANMIIRHIASAYYIAKSTAKNSEEEFDIFYRLVKDILAELV